MRDPDELVDAVYLFAVASILAVSITWVAINK